MKCYLMFAKAVVLITNPFLFCLAVRSANNLVYVEMDWPDTLKYAVALFIALYGFYSGVKIINSRWCEECDK